MPRAGASLPDEAAMVASNWPTPRANEATGAKPPPSRQGGASLKAMALAAPSPTPRVCSDERSSGMNRTEMYRAGPAGWPTPGTDSFRSRGGDRRDEMGLDKEFNSLDAQREACEAYVASQKAEGWAAIRERYDDGGFSGGTLERPALKQMIADIEAGLIDVIVVRKIDRLSRSLMDFAKPVEVFDRNNFTFVSVAQSLNTTTSMVRLTLNILLSFARFEREVIGERIRDKFAASRKRGMWMGGFVAMGYDVKHRKLVVNEAEAEIVRMIFDRFVTLVSASTLARALQAENVCNKRGKRIDKGFIYKLINNQVYLGEAVHKGISYPGEHYAIITH